MSGDRKTTSEQSSSFHEGASYDEVYPSGHGLEKGLSWSLERELSTHSLNDEEEDYDREKDYDGEEVEEAEGGEDEDEYDEGEEKCKGEEDEGKGNEVALEGGSSGSLGDGQTRPFILPAI